MGIRQNPNGGVQFEIIPYKYNFVNPDFAIKMGFAIKVGFAHNR
ncbi:MULTISPECIES: hypothetical protein [unclassified Ruminococcus]|nr:MULTISPECIES: hypothetical protein [unclassified Ruminococcus]